MTGGNLTDAHGNSISKCVKVYQHQGIEALFKVGHCTNKSLLESYITDIDELFSKEHPRSIGEAILKIKELNSLITF